MLWNSMQSIIWQTWISHHWKYSIEFATIDKPLKFFRTDNEKIQPFRSPSQQANIWPPVQRTEKKQMTGDWRSNGISRGTIPNVVPRNAVSLPNKSYNVMASTWLSWSMGLPDLSGLWRTWRTYRTYLCGPKQTDLSGGHPHCWIWKSKNLLHPFTITKWMSRKKTCYSMMFDV